MHLTFWSLFVHSACPNLSWSACPSLPFGSKGTSYSHKICGRASVFIPCLFMQSLGYTFFFKLYHYSHECWMIHLFPAKRQKLTIAQSFVKISVPCKHTMRVLYVLGSWIRKIPGHLHKFLKELDYVSRVRETL